MSENQQTVDQAGQKQSRFVRGAKNAAEYMADGSRGSIIDTIKITIRIIAEFVKAVNAKLDNSLGKLTKNKNEGSDE